MSEIINGFLSSAILTVSVYGFGAIIFNNKGKNKLIYTIIILLLSITFHTIIFLTIKGTLKTILLCIIFLLTFKFIFNIKYSRALLVTILYSILAIFPELLVINVSIYIFNISKEYFYSNIAGSILGSLLISILMILFTYLLRKPLRKLINYNLSTSKKIIIISVLTFLSIAIFFYSLINTFEFNDNIISYLIVIFTLIVILFYLFKQKIDNDNIIKKYDDLLNVMKTYETDIEEQRTIIHETKNELMTIKCKIKDKSNNQEIIKYIDSIIGDKTTSNMSKYSKFKYLPSNGLKGFFYYKFIEADKKGIKVSVNISKKIEKSFLGSIDTKDFKELVRIIGVYLDNAIESSITSQDKKLGIEIYQINNVIEIIISNTFAKDTNFDKVGKERYSTKGLNRGHGLLLVKKILNNNSMFESKTSITSELFIQTLKVKNISEE